LSCLANSQPNFRAPGFDYLPIECRFWSHIRLVSLSSFAGLQRLVERSWICSGENDVGRVPFSKGEWVLESDDEVPYSCLRRVRFERMSTALT